MPCAPQARHHAVEVKAAAGGLPVSLTSSLSALANLAGGGTIIANGFIHRDLDDWSQAFAVELRLRRDRLVVISPGGLYGITVDRLGDDAVTSARNAILVGICQHVRSAGSGGPSH